MALSLPNGDVSIDNYLNTLVIQNIQLHHSDVYSCIIENMIGRASASSQITVLPKDSTPPKIYSGRRRSIVNIISTDSATSVKIGKTIRIIKGALLKLWCTATGVPRPDIIWTLNRKPIVDDLVIQTSNMLVILSFKAQHSGSYKCVAKNLIGQARAFSDVRMIVPKPPHIISSNKIYKIADDSPSFEITIGDQLKASGGRDVIIACKTKSFPIAKLSWKNGNKMLEPTSKIFINDQQQTLTIKDANEWNSGTYSCFATNGAGIEMSSSKVKILPKGAPIIISPKQTITEITSSNLIDVEIGTNLTATTGKTLRMYCPTDGNEQVNYEWTINGEHLRYDTRINLENGNELIITDLQFFDDGLYSCRAYNQYGYDVMVSKIAILGSNNAQEKVQSTDVLPNNSFDGVLKIRTGTNIKLVSGQSVEILCATRGSSRPKLNWLKDGYPITPSNRIQPRGELLVLSVVDKSVAGEYTCVVTTIIGVTKMSSKVQVVDHQPVQIKRSYLVVKANDETSELQADIGSKIYAISGISIKIQCPYIAVPKPKIVWLFNMTKINENENYDIDKNILVISRMSIDLVGRYMCKALQNRLVQEVSSSLYLMAMKAPEISKSNRTVYSNPVFLGKVLHANAGDSLVVNLNKKVMLHCSGSGIPKPKVIWKFKDQAISLVEDIVNLKNGSLEIPKVSWKHSGEYLCYLVNSVGVALAKVDVKVVGIYTPTNIKPERKQVTILNTSKQVIQTPIGTNITVKKLNSVQLECPVSIYGNVAVKWEKNGKQFTGTQQYGDGSILISQLHAGHTGEYICYSDDSTKMKFGAVNVNVIVPPTKDLIKNKGKTDINEFLNKKGKDNNILVDVGTKIKVLSGHEMKLRCPVALTESTAIKWLRNNETLLNGKRYNLIGNYLLVKDTSETGTFNYTCILSGSLGETEMTSLVTVSGLVKLEVKRITQKLTSIKFSSEFYVGGTAKVLNGSRIDMICPAVSLPLPKIKWYYNDKVLFDGAGLFIKKDDSILSIPFVSKDQAGTYTCSASSNGDSGSASVQLSVYVHKQPRILYSNQVSKRGILGGPSVTLTSNNTEEMLLDSENVKDNLVEGKIGQDYKVVSGPKLKLACIIDGEPTPTIKWKKDGVKITSTDDRNDLIVDSSDLSASGFYTCTAANAFGSATESSLIDIIVPSAPIIQRESRNRSEILALSEGATKVEVFIGDDLKTLNGTCVSIRCPAIGIPRPTILFYKNGEQITELANDVYIDDLGSLIISPASKEHSSDGVYTCRAENDAGYDELQTTLTLYMSSKPKFLPIANTPQYKYNVAHKTGVLRMSVGQVVTTYPDTMLYIKCDVSGFPFPVVIWEKNGEIISDSGIGTLTDNSMTLVYKLGSSYGGVFICTATNMAGSIQRKAVVKMTDPLPPRILATQFEVITVKQMYANVTIGPNINVISTSTLQLTCPAIGEPKPIVVWSLSETSDKWLERRNNVKIAPNGYDIIIHNIDKSLAGEYKCTATNPFGSHTQVSMVTVEDMSIPVITQSIKSIIAQPGIEEISVIIGGELYVRQGMQVTIECPVSGSPPPDVTWLKDNEKLILTQDFHPIDHVLELYGITIEQEGVYTCVAKSLLETVKAKMELFVGDKPFIEKVSRNLSPVISIKADAELIIPIGVEKALVRTGSSIIFKCITKGYPLPNTTWYLNGYPVDFDNTAKFQSFISTALVVRELAVSDNGKYSCVASNVFGTSAKFTELHILEFPSILSSTKNKTITQLTKEVVTAMVGQTINIVKGMSVIVKCPAEGIPTPVITWSKTNGPFILDPRVFLTRENYLRIDKADILDSGRYKCSATNRVGVAHSISTLLVAEKPTAFIFPNYRSDKTSSKSAAVSYGKGHLMVPKGSHIRLYCHVTGSPIPKTIWLRDHDIVRLSDRIRIRGNELEVRYAKQSDEGIYLCLAENVMGSITALIDIKIGAAPRISRNTKPVLVPNDKIVQVAVGSAISVYVGTTVRINCTSSGVPKPVITWTKAGRRNVKFTRMQTSKSDVITIRDVTRQSEGKYTCEARNVIGLDKVFTIIYIIEPAQITSSIYMRKRYKERLFLMKRDTEVHVIEGERLRFICASDGLPKPNVTFTRIHEQQESTEIFNPLGNINPVKLKNYLKSLEPQKGGILKSALDPHHSFKVNFKHFLRSRHRIIKGKRLVTTVLNVVVKSAKVRHAGLYLCKSENRAGKDEVQIKLVVYPKPSNKFSGVWIAKPFTNCSEPCVRSNYGLQTRPVKCMIRGGIIVPSRHCDDHLKMISQKDCWTSKCSTQWNAGKWSKCSQTCGSNGRQVRTPYCVYTKLNKKTDPNNCPAKSKPIQTRSCNVFSCIAEKCVDKYQYCALMRKLGFCRIETYKTFCCESCVKYNPQFRQHT